VQTQRYGLWAFIDRSGDAVRESLFLPESPAPQFSEGLSAVSLEIGGPVGYIDQTGKIVIEPQFYTAQPFDGGLAAVRPQERGLWGYIDKTGEMVIEPQFYVAGSFSRPLAGVQLRAGGPWGYIDRSGRWVWQSE
jgi:hypothetical protein